MLAILFFPRMQRTRVQWMRSLRDSIRMGVDQSTSLSLSPWWLPSQQQPMKCSASNRVFIHPCNTISTGWCYFSKYKYIPWICYIQISLSLTVRTNVKLNWTCTSQFQKTTNKGLLKKKVVVTSSHSVTHTHTRLRYMRCQCLKYVQYDYGTYIDLEHNTTYSF